MDNLLKTDSLLIKQKKEWGELLTGFETKNSYLVKLRDGSDCYNAIEESGFISRFLLRNLRPFTIKIVNMQKQPVIYLSRPFKFYFHTMFVKLPGGEVIGRIERQFSFLRRIYKVMNQFDEVQYILFGPIFKPWTFEIMQKDIAVGKIVKKWSGALTEFFTDADNFGIIFPENSNAKDRALLLGAVFLIDFIHFDDNTSS